MDAIRRLLDHVGAALSSRGQRDDEGARRWRFLQAVTERVARVGAQWMLAGFVHGVLNTDNINVTGESFDYGPWRFLPSYQPDFTAAYFDTGKLYAFGRQPDTLLWNLVRLAECLLPLATQEALEPVLLGFGERFGAELAPECCAGSAVRRAARERTRRRAGRRGWRCAKRRCRSSGSSSTGMRRCRRAIRNRSSRRCGEMLSAHATAPGAGREHAYFRHDAPCTMLIDEVEAIWAPIAAEDDWSAFHAKLDDIALMAAALA